MSHNVKMTGVKYHLDFNFEKQKEILKILFPNQFDKAIKEYGDGKDMLYELCYMFDNETNQWKPYMDYDGKLGLIYAYEHEESYGDIDMNISYNKLMEHYQDLKSILGDIRIVNLGVFAIDYYNGTDCPFKY